MSAEGRVEHQKLNQTTALLLFGWVCGVPLDSLEKSVLANAEKRVDIIPAFEVISRERVPHTQFSENLELINLF